jgi:transcriptional regulator with XRE-family HTH domain
MKIPKHSFPLPQHATGLTLAELAKVCGMSRRTIEGYTADGLLLPDPSGGYNTADLEQIILDKIEAKQAQEDAQEPASEWAELKLEYQARLAGLKYERERGQLIDREEVIERETQIALLFKSELLSLPYTLAPQLYGLSVEQMAERITDKVHEVLEKIVQENEEEQIEVEDLENAEVNADNIIH